MRLSAVVALGLVCLAASLGLAACGGGSSHAQRSTTARAVPGAGTRAPQARREQSRRVAKAARVRARKAAAAGARAQRARRRALAAARRPHVALPPAAAVRAA